MDYIEQGYSTNSFNKLDMLKRMSFVKLGFIFLIAIYGMRVIYSTLFTIFYYVLGSASYSAINIIGVILSYSSIALAIASLVLFIIGFFNLSNNFNSEINSSMRLSAIFLVIFIGFNYILLFLLDLIFLFLFHLTGVSATIFEGITNIISIALVLIAFVFMNFTIQKTHKFGLSSKSTFSSSYFTMITGLTFAVYSIVYSVLSLPYYSFIIVYLLYSISLIISFTEYLFYLNSFYIKQMPEQESYIPQ